MQTFSQQLHALRKERGYTQEQLAQRLNVSRTTISRWESGHTLPDIETLKLLSQVLEYNFFTNEDIAPAPEEPAPSQPQETLTQPVRPKLHPRWMAALGALLLIAVLTLLLYRDQLFGPRTALIEVTAASEIVYLQPWPADSGKTGLGYDAVFYFANKSKVPFTPEYVRADYYEGDRIAITIHLSHQDLRAHMRNDKLLSVNDPLDWGFGTDQTHLTHLTVTMYGTDDNGNKLEASCTVQYAKEQP